jgi:3-hydroxybutyrate dehydrogenase
MGQRPKCNRSSNDAYQNETRPKNGEKIMLNGKTALVTGSTSGIGLGIAEAFAQQGCHIVLNGFGDAREIEDLCHRLEGTHRVSVRYHGADMSKPESIADMMDSVIGYR